MPCDQSHIYKKHNECRDTAKQKKYSFHPIFHPAPMSRILLKTTYIRTLSRLKLEKLPASKRNCTNLPGVIKLYHPVGLNGLILLPVHIHKQHGVIGV